MLNRKNQYTFESSNFSTWAVEAADLQVWYSFWVGNVMCLFYQRIVHRPVTTYNLEEGGWEL